MSEITYNEARQALNGILPLIHGLARADEVLAKAEEVEGKLISLESRIPGLEKKRDGLQAELNDLVELTAKEKGVLNTIRREAEEAVTAGTIRAQAAADVEIRRAELAVDKIKRDFDREQTAKRTKYRVEIEELEAKKSELEKTVAGLRSDLKQTRDKALKATEE